MAGPRQVRFDPEAPYSTVRGFDGIHYKQAGVYFNARGEPVQQAQEPASLGEPGQKKPRRGAGRRKQQQPSVPPAASVPDPSQDARRENTAAHDAERFAD